MGKNLSTLVILCLTYYYLILSGINFSSTSYDQPQLKDRFGTTIWHTSDRGGEEATYCYYPSVRSDYVLKKVESLNDCNDWYGVAVLYEGKYATELNKYL